MTQLSWQVFCQLYLQKTLNTEIGVSVLTQCLTLCCRFKFSWGYSAAPPDQRQRRPERLGARLSFLRPPTSFLQCLGDLKWATQWSSNDVTNVKYQKEDKGNTGRIQIVVLNVLDFLTWQLIRQIETQLVQNLGHDGVTVVNAEHTLS